MQNDPQVDLHVLQAETALQLRVLTERIRENQAVLQALDFGRFVLNSGICGLLDLPASTVRHGLHINGRQLRGQVEELLRECQERLRSGNADTRLTVDDTRTIHEKLDALADQVARFASGCELKVISGGLGATGSRESAAIAKLNVLADCSGGAVAACSGLEGHASS